MRRHGDIDDHPQAGVPLWERIVLDQKMEESIDFCFFLSIFFFLETATSEGSPCFEHGEVLQKVPSSSLVRVPRSGINHRADLQ